MLDGPDKKDHTVSTSIELVGCGSVEESQEVQVVPEYQVGRWASSRHTRGEEGPGDCNLRKTSLSTSG